MALGNQDGPSIPLWPTGLANQHVSFFSSLRMGFYPQDAWVKYMHMDLGGPPLAFLTYENEHV